VAKVAAGYRPGQDPVRVPPPPSLATGPRARHIAPVAAAVAWPAAKLCTGDFRKEGAVHARTDPSGAVPALFKTLFMVVGLLLLAAVGYAGWVVLRYWDQVGV
jgi:hypothetical protein